MAIDTIRKLLAAVRAPVLGLTAWGAAATTPMATISDAEEYEENQRTRDAGKKKNGKCPHPMQYLYTTSPHVVSPDEVQIDKYLQSVGEKSGANHRLKSLNEVERRLCLIGILSPCEGLRG